MAVQMLTFVLLARLATPAPFGSYSKTYSYLLVVIGLSDLGVQALVGREFAVPELRDWGRRAYWLQACLAGVTATVACVGLALFTTHGAVKALIPWQVFVEIQQACTLALALAAGHAQVQVRTILVSRLPVLVAMLAASASHVNGYPVLVVYLLTTIASTLTAVLWVLVHLDILKNIGIPKDWRSILSKSRHFLLSSASWQVRQLDTALVGWAANATQAAFYAVPARLVGPLRLFDTSLTAVVVPYVRRGEKDRVLKFTKVMAAVVLAMSVGFAVVSVYLPRLVKVILGESYLPTVGPLRAMLAATAALMAANYITAVIQAAGRERFVGLQGGALAALFVVLVPLGAHLWAATGAAIAVLIINGLQLVSSLAVARSVFREFVTSRSTQPQSATSTEQDGHCAAKAGKPRRASAVADPRLEDGYRDSCGDPLTRPRRAAQ